MPKYQCNVCGKIYSLEWDAIRCHPDINIINDDALPTRDAAEQRNAAVALGQPCPSCLGYGILDMQDVGWIICDDCQGTGSANRPTRG